MDAHGSTGNRVDQRLRALAHADRRAVLHALSGDDYHSRSPILIDGSDALDLDSSVAEMHHRHLPMLSELDLVCWETAPLAVVRGPQFHDVEPLLAHLSTTLDDSPSPSA